MIETILVALISLIAGGGVVALVLSRRAKPAEPDPAAERLAELQRAQAETSGHLRALGDMLGTKQAELQRTVNERLDSLSQRVGQSLQSSTQNTVDNLQKLNERLAVIDRAQKNIAELSTQVSSLHGVLANKQSRGAFGQGQLEAIIADILPKGAYEFQFTLSNRTRPDCAIFMPDAAPLIIDAKFPLEAMTALRAAATDDERKAASQRVKQDIAKHIADIAGKYLLPGETQDIALMFIPSESVYADLHEQFDDLVQRAQRARVMIVSPTLMVLSITVIKQLRKDAQMREAANEIRREVGHMMKDVGLLGERVRKLQTHFGQANDDLTNILTSTGRIEKRAAKIEDLEFDSESDKGNVIPAPITRRLQAGE
jgi:DNA recombination protein RmuC